MSKSLKAALLWGLAVAVVLGAAMQAVRPSLGKSAGPAAEIAAPAEVRAVLERRCYACHSDEPRLAWFDEPAPVYWMVAKDVRDARARLNFSELGNKPVAVQRAELYEAVNQVRLGAMPLPAYLAVHRGAGVTAEELKVLQDYLAPFAPTPSSAAAAVPVAGVVAAGPVGEKMPAGESANGVPFEAGFRTWKLLSATDRGDNHTLRIITGNDVAIKAVEEHQTHPWPDGAAFAKIAYAAVDDGQGNLVPGKFVQVEFMEKDAAKYARTKGWGYARFRGDALKPYGEGTHFDEECVGCHEPVKDHDYVYSLPIARDAVGGGR
ncbi:MAG: cytochrome P460 family protein [Acidobacteriota bacterium]